MFINDSMTKKLVSITRDTGHCGGQGTDGEP